MEKQKLCLGVVKRGAKKVTTIGSVRMDLTSREEAIELLSQLVEAAYDEYESEGLGYELDDERDERY